MRNEGPLVREALEAERVGGWCCGDAQAHRETTLPEDRKTDRCH